MEKKEIGFADKFEEAGNELEKEIKDGCGMILIATSEGVGVSARIEGNSCELSILLAYVAIKDKGFKTILTNAIKCVEAYEQRNK